MIHISRRNIKISVRLSQSEHEHLKKQAENCGLKHEPFVRFLIMGTEVRPRPPNEYAALLHQLSGIANNFNQIARMANTKKYITRKEIERALQLIDKAWDAVKKYL